MPSQKQVRWAELRVGLTVIFASIIFIILVFLMTSATGLFTKKIYLFAYVDNASGLRVGAPVRLEGVDVGNVEAIRLVPDKGLTPVEIKMKVSTRYTGMMRKGAVISISTAGVLGESFVAIDSRAAEGGPVQDGDVLLARDAASIDDVVRASQTTLENLDIVLKRMDRIVAAIEKGEGTIGKFIYDPSMFNRINAMLGEMNTIVGDVNRGKGSIGKLLKDEELYARLNSTVTRVDTMVSRIEQGEGTLGKLVKDPSLYNNANQSLAKVNSILEHANQGKGALGKLTKDEQFAQNLDNTMARIAAISARLEAGEGSAGKLLKDPSLYTNADQMLVETRNLVKAIRENPKKYLTIHFRIF